MREIDWSIDLIDFCVRLLHLAVTCPIDSSLNKNSAATGQKVDFPATVVSDCDHGQRFDDGLSEEKMKCSAARPTGLWNHRQYSCDGNYFCGDLMPHIHKFGRFHLTCTDSAKS